MGDNRSNSADSRFHLNDAQHGQVPIRDIAGVAFARYWPFFHTKQGRCLFC